MFKFLLILFSLIIIPISANAATLSLSPSSGSFNVGDILTAQILLDTQGQAIDGVDIQYLNYNPSLLEAQDEDSAIAGVQIKPGNLTSFTTQANLVDTVSGKISFSQITNGNATFNGGGLLATVRFKAIASGNANLFFNATPGDTTDTNVASGAVEVLTSVVNGSYQISSPPPPPPTNHMFSLNPSSGSFKTGDLVDMQILLDTQGKAIDGVDVVLSYNTSLFTVEDSDVDQEGKQILDKGLLPNTQRNEVTTAGKIYFSQVTSGNSTFIGSGVLADIHFRAKAVGSNATVKFNFIQGMTNDSNVSFSGADLLKSVGDAVFDITSNNQPPIILNNTPSLVNLSKTLTLKIETTESATCRYSSASYTAYDLMTGRFSSSNAIDHTANLSSGFVVGNNYFYVKCKDLSGQISESDTEIFVNVVSDISLPVISRQTSLSPVFLVGSMSIKVVTDEPSYCRYSLTPNISYDAMTKSLTGSNLDHTATVSGLKIGDNIFYIKCKDRVGNINPADFNYQFNTVEAPKFIVNLEGQSNLSASSVTISFYSPNSSVEISKITAKPNIDGVVVLPNNFLLSPGFYDIQVSSSSYLVRKMNNFNLSGGSSVLFPILLGGDLNNDGVVNTLDWSRMDTDWSKSSSVADINKDRIVNSSDWGYIRKNWLQRG